MQCLYVKIDHLYTVIRGMKKNVIGENEIMSNIEKKSTVWEGEGGGGIQKKIKVAKFNVRHRTPRGEHFWPNCAIFSLAWYQL